MTPFSLENDIEFQETEELLLIYTLVGPVDTWSTCMPIICTHVTTATVILPSFLRGLGGDRQGSSLEELNGKAEDLAYGEDVWEGEEVWRTGKKVKKGKGSCLSETMICHCSS